MITVLKRSTDNPLDQPAVSKIFDVVLKAQAMGLISKNETIDAFSFTLTRARELLKQIANHGIGRVQLHDLAEWHRLSSIEIAKRLDKLDQILEESAKPETEWQAVRQYINDQMLSHMLGVSEISIRRYARATRETPPEIAQRLHFLALVIGDLSGSYDDLGIAQWFVRPRKKAFAGKTPYDLLSGDWQPEDEWPSKIRNFANSLNSFVST